jgi:hypothetical protein
VWRFGRLAQPETLTHEFLHLKQQKFGRDPYRRRGGGHNKEFCTMAKQIGLNVFPVIGYHYYYSQGWPPMLPNKRVWTSDESDKLVNCAFGNNERNLKQPRC